jgi:hypothetical protein
MSILFLTLKILKIKEFDWNECNKFKKENENIDFMHRQFLQESDGGRFL